MTPLERLLARLEGRMENALRTFALHPDPLVRRDAEVRALAYATARADVESIFNEIEVTVSPGYFMLECGCHLSVGNAGGKLLVACKKHHRFGLQIILTEEQLNELNPLVQDP
jgi:hypothetical protein